MKIHVKFLLICGTLLAFCPAARAQGTAFTYQGQLQNNGAPANGSYDLQFILFNTNQFGFPAAPILTNAAVTVNNGLFTTTLDFGDGIFTGTNFWLDISVRTNGNGAFIDLSPRQPITPTPYAITAANLSDVVENNTIQGAVSLATISGGGGNVIQSGANNSTIGGGGYNTIQSGADHSTIGGGYSDEIQGGAWESFIGGGQGNFIESNAVWSAIGGGLNNVIQTNATYSAIFGGLGNTIYASYSFIGGGYFNMIQSNIFCSTISGGQQNAIQTDSQAATIGGGLFNTILTNSFASTIAGGEYNTIQPNANYSTIGGGLVNTVSNQFATVSGGYHNAASGVGAFVGGGGYDGFDGGGFNVASGPASVVVGGVDNSSSGYDSFVGAGVFNNASGQDAVVVGGSGNLATNVYSTIGGGVNNTNTGFSATVGGGLQNTASGSEATVPGGYGNVASELTSFAAGNQAHANNQGAFVWADSQNAAFSSTANDQFLVRAQGGVGINMNNPGGASLYVQGNRSGTPGNAFVQSVGFFENTSGANGTPGSSPALRVVCDGGSTPNGALSVSANGNGLIAQFGNAGGFVASIANDGTLTCKSLIQTSDRNAKQNFMALDGKAVLAKVVSLPVTEWNYKDDAVDKKHIGPMAQDFRAAFDLNGADDKHISVIDEGGVALAAIQGLNQKLQDDLNGQAVENANLKRQNNVLVQRLDELEAAVKTLAQKKQNP